MELVEVALPSGKKAFLKGELTSGDVDDINVIFFQAVGRVSVSGPSDKENSIDPVVLVKMKYALLERAVVSIQDGEAETKHPNEEFFRNMSPRDIAALEKSANEIMKASSVSEDEKKDSSSPTSSASTPEASKQ